MTDKKFTELTTEQRGKTRMNGKGRELIRAVDGWTYPNFAISRNMSSKKRSKLAHKRERVVAYCSWSWSGEYWWAIVECIGFLYTEHILIVWEKVGFMCLRLAGMRAGDGYLHLSPCLQAPIL